MRAFFAVYKREVKLFFNSNIAYAIAFGLLLFLGLIFADTAYNAALQNVQGVAQGGGLNADYVLLSTLSVLVFLMFIVAPLLTMRLISEESREGTLEVLMTLPMGDWAFILGKFFAVWTFYTFILLATLLYAAILSTIGVPDAGAMFAAYLGAWLYGGVALAVSMIWSAVTDDQIVAAFLGAATVLMLFLADRLAGLAQSRDFLQGAGEFIRELSLTAHYHDTMLQGIIRAEDVVYFAGMMAFALFVTTIIVGTRRWRAS